MNFRLRNPKSLFPVHPRAFTLIEMVFALGILVTLLASVAALNSRFDARQRQLWEEFTANELATTVLERTLAAGPLEATPEEGRVIAFETLAPGGAAPLPDLKLSVQVRRTGGLCTLHAVVSWLGARGGVPGERLQVERELKWRAGP